MVDFRKISFDELSKQREQLIGDIITVFDAFVVKTLNPSISVLTDEVSESSNNILEVLDVISKDERIAYEKEKDEHEPLIKEVDEEVVVFDGTKDFRDWLKNKYFFNPSLTRAEFADKISNEFTLKGPRGNIYTRDTIYSNAPKRKDFPQQKVIQFEDLSTKYKRKHKISKCAGWKKKDPMLNRYENFLIDGTCAIKKLQEETVSDYTFCGLADEKDDNISYVIAFCDKSGNEIKDDKGRIISINNKNIDKEHDIPVSLSNICFAPIKRPKGVSYFWNKYLSPYSNEIEDMVFSKTGFKGEVYVKVMPVSRV